MAPRLDIIHGDRRSDRRYDLELELRFSYKRRGVTYIGSGRTLDLSGGGVLFTSDSAVPEGQEIELRVAWPFLLQNVCPLEVLIRGTVLRTDARGAVVRMRDYEFRTCGERSFDQAIVTATACNILG
jgi:hypothetical protein